MLNVLRNTACAYALAACALPVYSALCNIYVASSSSKNTSKFDDQPYLLAGCLGQTSRQELVKRLIVCTSRARHFTSRTWYVNNVYMCCGRGGYCRRLGSAGLVCCYHPLRAPYSYQTNVIMTLFCNTLLLVHPRRESLWAQLSCIGVIC